MKPRKIYPRVAVPSDILKTLNKQSDAAGYGSMRADTTFSRWTYLKKLLALGRQYKDVLKAN